MLLHLNEYHAVQLLAAALWSNHSYSAYILAFTFIIQIAHSSNLVEILKNKGHFKV